MKNIIKDKSVGFFIGAAACVLMFLSDILYIILDSSDRTFSLLSCILIFAGSAVWILSALIPEKKLSFFPFIACALFGTAFAHCLILGLETLSDVWNNVNFVGGNPTMAVLFIVLFFVGTLTAVISSFCGYEKKESIE